METLRWILVSAHVLAGAAWFGAMFYSLTLVHPRARSFFGEARKLEEFITYLAAGARWKVLSGAGLIAVTGLALWCWPSPAKPVSATASACVWMKLVLFVLALGLFCVTSWVWWPARLMAGADEVPRFQRRFRLVGLTLLTLVGLSFALALLK
jgi:hypothetical protein